MRLDSGPGSQPALGRQRVPSPADPASNPPPGGTTAGYQLRIAELAELINQLLHRRLEEPGRYACLTCGTPVTVEPCPKHSPQVQADAFAQLVQAYCTVCDVPVMLVHLEDRTGWVHLTGAPTATHAATVTARLAAPAAPTP